MGLPFEDLENGNGQTTSYGSGNPKFILDSLSASPYNSANKFSFHLTQGSLKFVNLHAKLSGSYPLAKFLVPNTWKTKFSIENETSLVLNRPISITRLEDDRQFVPDKLENLEYEIEFEHTTVTPATSSTYLTSYADVTFGNLRTYSGDVNKVKLFGRQKDQQNKEFEKFGEFILQTNNELKDSTSVTGNDPIGIFYSQSVVDNFWQSSSAAQPISTNNSRIMNAVLVSGSNYTDGSYVEFKTKNQFELEKNEEYIVSFKSYYIKKNKQQADGSVRQSAEIEVFLSGSITSQTGDVLSLGSVSDFGDNASELLVGNVSGSIPILYNYFTTHKKSGAKPKAGLVFRVNAGEFYISDVKLEPIADRNFNPGFYKTFVPMPKTARRGQRYDFVAEFYDSDNNKSDFEAVTSASVLFAGAKQVLADGEDAVLTGSVLIGDSLEMYGVNPAYLRSVGYNGFDKTIAGTGDRNGGFMLFSGSVGTAIGASETYNGVGLEVVDASGSNKFNHSFLQFASNYKGTGSPRFRVQTSEFLLGISGSGVAGDAYISGSQGNLEMSSSNFFLKQDGSVIMQGTITATAGGTIGGFTVGSSSLSVGSVFQISSSQNANDPASFISSSAFKVSAGGKVTGSNILLTGGTIGGFELASTQINDTGDNLLLKSSGHITGSKVLFDGGKIGGWTISDNILASSVGATSGVVGGIRLNSNGDSAEISIKGHSFGAAGIQLGFNEDSPRFYAGDGSNNFLKFTTNNGVDIKTAKFLLDTDRLDIDSDNSRISIFDDASSPKERIRIGEVDGGSVFGMKIFDGTGTADSDILVEFGEGGNKIASWTVEDKKLSSFSTSTQDKFGIAIDADTQLITIHGNSSEGKNNVGANDRDNVRLAIGQLASNEFGIKGFSTGDGSANSGKRIFELSSVRNEIAGWTFDNEKISSNNLIINSTGSIETSNYVSGISGFSLSAKNNGFLEVQQAKIRGTLSTTVFEKESVNAVGGQLLVANSTTITGSTAVSASQVTMSVTNVTGFAQNEILLIKKVSGTGFNTEYVKVLSSSRDGTNDNDLTGRIMVERGYQSGSAVFAGAKHSGSIAEISENSSSYEPGQVIVSTGKIGTGYIRLNANPNDVTTPYIDIVERTGSGVFDVDLKARLGDLSGISSTLVGSSPGFGLFSENVFLTGKITATSGEIGGFAITSNAVSSSNGNLRLKSNGQITGSAVDLSGKITATSGEIGGFTVDGHSLTTTGVEINDSTQALFINTANFDVSHAGNVTASNVDLSGKLTATSGEIAGWDISGNTIRKLSGNAGITLDSGKSQIIASGSFTDNPGNGVIIDGVNGILQVSQSGTTIFESGIRTQFRQIPDFFVKSQPTALLSDARLALTPLTLVTDISASKKTVGGIPLVGGRISVHQAFVEEGFRMTTKDPGTSFLYQTSRTIDGANEDVPVPVIFDDQRTVDIASNADYMHQSYVFNTNYISDDSADAIRFVGNGATTGSATFQIQATLTDTSDNNFTDAKLNLLGLDVDTSTLPTARQNEYTFLQARHSSSIRAQLQHDGDFVSAGNLTAFGTSFLQVSDERLKQNIYTISQSLDKILDLRPTKYVWKKNKKQDVGFIAQEVEKIIPEVVEESRGFINDDSQIENMKTISYPKLIPYLVDTIQVLVKRIEDLEERFVKK